MHSAANPSRRSRLSIALAAFVCALASIVWAPDAEAIVCANRDALDTPANGYVGWWNGSSAVCVGPNWIVSAKHVGGTVNGLFWMRGVSYRAVEIRQHPTQDIQIIRVAETLPGYHRLATNVTAGDLAILGGYGNTAGTAVANGFDWTGAQAETWGANLIENAGTLIVIDFDSPGSSTAVPNESIFAVHDSGAGLFVYGLDGSLELAGVAVSVTGYGSSVYGNSAFCLNMDFLRTWIQPTVDPSAPITSSAVAPRAGIFDGGTHSMVWGLAVSLGFVFRRRRV